MTTAGVRQSAPGAAPAPVHGAIHGWLRLAYLYLVSRRAPAALALLAAFGALLWAALHWHWNIAGGPAAQLVIPLTIETGAAAVIAVTAHGPFGEPERATGRWLPYLRLGAIVAQHGQKTAGITGIGLLSAVVLGGALAWTGPMAYLVLTETALAGNATTPWVWPARPPHDLGGALCAATVFAAGALLITVRGAREAVRD